MCQVFLNSFRDISLQDMQTGRFEVEDLASFFPLTPSSLYFRPRIQFSTDPPLQVLNGLRGQR